MDCPVSGGLFPATISCRVLFPHSHIHKPKCMIRRVKMLPENTEVRTRLPLPEVFILPRSEEPMKKRASGKPAAGIVLLTETSFATLFFRVNNCRLATHQVCLHAYNSCSNRSIAYIQSSCCAVQTVLRIIGPITHGQIACTAPTDLANSNNREA